jgi:hypothetical protein
MFPPKTTYSNCIVVIRKKKPDNVCQVVLATSVFVIPYHDDDSELPLSTELSMQPQPKITFRLRFAFASLQLAQVFFPFIRANLQPVFNPLTSATVCTFSKYKARLLALIRSDARLYIRKTLKC